MQIQMSKNVTLEFCEVCDSLTPVTEVTHIDVINHKSWNELECKYCFDDSLEWEERYG